MDKCRLSIIIPVYNAEEYIDRCIRSVLSQDLLPYEVILVDDGSTDSSPLICDRYSATDPRFRTIHKPNGGVSSARNAGLDIAKGEYVIFIDSDDALLPCALDMMTEAMDGADLVVGGYAVFMGDIPDREVVPDKEHLYRGGDVACFFEDHLRRNCEMLDAPWAKLFRRKTIGSLRFNTALSYAEDKLFVFTYLLNCSSVRTCSSAVYAYHIRPGSLGSDIVSDSHLKQLRVFLPAYSDILSELCFRYPSGKKLHSLYHNDVIARYVCRILNIFLTKRTQMLTVDYLEWLYGLMDADRGLGLFSVRPGQIFNIGLYLIGRPSFSVKVYRLTSRVASLFGKKK